MVATTDITTADGVVRGIRGRRVSRWRSIPFAAPAVGDLRFRAPQPVQPWSGVRDATDFGYAAMQHRDGARIGPRQAQPTGEDCLTLNVTVPNEPAATPRPVMVFIHGGGYMIGTSALRLYSGARLALRGDVIVVSINYRLGAFGYLDFGEYSTPTAQFDSNMGLRDQVAALEWVRRNIGAFGGDPNNVTIFGESAGAHAVLALMCTPAAAGLFHRGIAQSAPADWAPTQAEARLFARRCLDDLGVAPQDAAKALRELPANEIRRAVDRTVSKVMHDQPGLFPVAPVVDGDYLPTSLITAFANGTAHRVPLIIGTNRDEATLFVRFDDTLPTTPDRMRWVLRHVDQALSEGGGEAPIFTKLGQTMPTSPERMHEALADFGAAVESRVAAAYPGFPGKRAAVRMGGDFTFWRPSVRVMEAHSRFAPTYAYRYDFAPRAIQLAGFGATHALDLIPVFGAVDSVFGRALTSAGGHRAFRAVSRQFQDNWLSFARSGTPLANWPAYTEERRATLIIDSPSRVEIDPERDKRLAWQGVRIPALT
ncbi:carboxylesterase/lipase family protein [Nocardia sp. CDC153]|uniref:carboxylesterase/lipase family protein n=1 Tax=Nocardia sp. CDC153 TaxID=3112167 RepID=UPI002DBECE9D|nr:carboxylesterase/lipase family protein [Nocardia sp. CDC153]MEC3951743.1 carboxylesterase/lipase family protein [Nocardia sp. CDC153]